MTRCNWCVGFIRRDCTIMKRCVQTGLRRDSDTRRMAETPKSGSVRSTGSAGLKGIAQ